MDYQGEIYIGSVLLEKNRWTEKKVPTFRVSEWVDRFAADGFDGVELWANHAAIASEVERLTSAACPISIFSSYVDFTDAAETERKDTAKNIKSLNCPRIKYNVGAVPIHWEAYQRNLQRWRDGLPDTATLLCECHPGTVIEEAVDAHRFFDEMGMNGHGIIVHPFSRMDSLVEWFETFGSAIQHAHLQLRDEKDQFIRFDRQPERVREALRIMKDYGFQGSFTLEFTEGTRQPGENIEDLYRNALRDLACLKDALSEFFPW
jgi:sugar phosphate isomerase/epimerase